MATKAELEQIIADKLLHKREQEVTLAEIRDAILATDAAGRAQVLTAIKTKNSNLLGSVFMDQIRTYLKSVAITEAQVLLTDDALTLAELDRILG